MRKLDWVFPVDLQTVREKLPRAEVSIAAVTPQVSKIIEEVRSGGQRALLEHAERFDGVRPKELLVPKDELRKALAAIDPVLREAIELSIERVTKVSAAQLPSDSNVQLTVGGSVVNRYVPVDSVGLYVPGGKAVYPSSVVMNAVPAQVAKVPRLAIASPAQAQFAGLPHPSVLATAELLGIDEVYAIGGASAVAAFAFGVAEIGLHPTSLVTGPGNIFVAAAKRLLRAQIGIDSEAGPTEIMVIADESAKPELVAADLISQAEHDENAASVLLTNSAELADQVEREIANQVLAKANRERVQIALSGNQSAIVLVENLDQAVKIANHYATEHLSIQTTHPHQLAGEITNAGAIFLGDYSPVSLGDYLAGSNHVLPTGEQARFSSGLNVLSFLRSQQLIDYSAEALREVQTKLVTFSHAEGLSAHGDAVTIRFS